jgi:hypothetical protein
MGEVPQGPLLARGYGGEVMWTEYVATAEGMPGEQSEPQCEKRSHLSGARKTKVIVE